MMNNKSDMHQDLFAYAINQTINPNTPGRWVDIGARNFGGGYGQNNTEFLYEHGWGGLSLDIEDFTPSYAMVDPKRVQFKPLDCTDAELLLQAFQENNVPTVVEYLSFDIDDSTEKGMAALKYVIDAGGYIFNCITIEHDSYRAGTAIRDFQRSFFTELGYTMVAELHMYEDWWVHNSVYTPAFEILKRISDEVKHDGVGYTQEGILLVKNTLLELLK